MNLQDLIEKNVILMHEINYNLNDSDKDIEDLANKQTKIKKINKNNKYYLDNISNIYNKIYMKFSNLLYNNENIENKNIENIEQIENNKIEKIEQIENNKIENIENEGGVLKFMAEKIRRKLDKQNEILDEITIIHENNLIDNNNNIKLINKLL